MSNNPAETKEWKDLVTHRTTVENTTMRDLFSADEQRFSKFSVKIDHLLFDYSKNRITEQTVEKLVALAKARDLEGWRARMFSGDIINTTEKRAVLHTALRRPKSETVSIDG